MTRTFYRSAVTGAFVSKAYAEAHPDTTMAHRYTFNPRTHRYCRPGRRKAKK